MTNSIISITDATLATGTRGGDIKALTGDQNSPVKTRIVFPQSKIGPTETVPIQTNLSVASVTTAEGLEDSVNFINHSMQNIQRDLSFSIDADSNRTVIKVLDSKSGSVIRQIPTEQALDMVNRIKESTDANGGLPQGLLFSDHI
jgi:flagellar protein FlaG|tara:strand:+ start:331 stop:765 length:435 start_codon:yes stop_codon:yes gene_type:complete